MANQENFTEKHYSYHHTSHRSTARDLNDIRSSIRETLSYSRNYSRSLKMMQNRRSLQDSIRAVTASQFTFPNSNCDSDAERDDEQYCNYDSNSDDRSPSPASSLASSIASSDSFNYVQKSNELPQFMLEVNRREAIRKKPVRLAKRFDLYKGHLRFDIRRVQRDKSKIIQEFQAFMSILIRNHTNRASILDLMYRDWQVLLNVLDAQDPETFRDCICILTSLISQNLIPLPLLMEMIRNNLLILLKKNTSSSTQYYCPIIICRLLLTILESQPACAYMVLEMLASTRLLDELISHLIVTYRKHEPNEILLLFYYVSQIIIDSLSRNTCKTDHLPEVPLLWTKIIEPNHIEQIFDCALLHRQLTEIDVGNSKLALSIFVNTLKMLYVSVDTDWGRRTLNVFCQLPIVSILSSSLEQRLQGDNYSPDRYEAMNNYAGFLSFYQQYFPDLYHQNIDLISREDGIDAWGFD